MLSARDLAATEVYHRCESAFNSGELDLATRLDTFLRTLESMSDQEFMQLCNDPVPGSFTDLGNSYSPIPID